MSNLTLGEKAIILVIFAVFIFAMTAFLTGCTTVVVEVKVRDAVQARLDGRTMNPFSDSTITFAADDRTSTTATSVRIERKNAQSSGQNAALSTVAGLVGGIVGRAVIP